MSEEDENVRRSGRQRIPSKRFQDMVVEPTGKRRINPSVKKTAEKIVASPPRKRVRVEQETSPLVKCESEVISESRTESLEPMSLSSALMVAENSFQDDINCGTSALDVIDTENMQKTNNPLPGTDSTPVIHVSSEDTSVTDSIAVLKNSNTSVPSTMAPDIPADESSTKVSNLVTLLSAENVTEGDTSVVKDKTEEGEVHLKECSGKLNPNRTPVAEDITIPVANDTGESQNNVSNVSHEDVPREYWSSEKPSEAVSLVPISGTSKEMDTNIPVDKTGENESSSNLLHVIYDNECPTTTGENEESVRNQQSSTDDAAAMHDPNVAAHTQSSIGSSESLMNTRLEICSSLQEASQPVESGIQEADNSLVLSLEDLSQNNVVMDSNGQFIIMDWNSATPVSSACEGGGPSVDHDMYTSMLTEPLAGDRIAQPVVNSYATDNRTITSGSGLSVPSLNSVPLVTSSSSSNVQQNLPHCIALVNLKTSSKNTVRGNARQASSGISLLGTPSNCVSLLKSTALASATGNTTSLPAPNLLSSTPCQKSTTFTSDATPDSLMAVDVTNCFSPPQTAVSVSAGHETDTQSQPNLIQVNTSAVEAAQNVKFESSVGESESTSLTSTTTAVQLAASVSESSSGTAFQETLSFGDLKTLASGKSPVSIKFITLNQPPSASEAGGEGMGSGTTVVTVESAVKPLTQDLQEQGKADQDFIMQGPVLVDGVYNCVYCPYQTEKRTNWYKHKRSHMGQRIYQCEKCEYQATTTSNLKRHLLTHTDHKEFQCTTCGAEFRQKIHLERHVKYKHEEKRIKCEFCDYVCANINPDLKIHLRRKHLLQSSSGEAATRLICQKCSFLAASRRDLAQHMKFHRKGPELKLYCEMCSFVTDCESRLKRHLRTHTNEKPYACKECSYQASQREHIVRHMEKKHNIVLPKTQTKKPKTETVDEQVDEANDNDLHKLPRKKYPPADFSRKEKVFACTHCTMKFAKLLNLYKHLQVQHPDVSLARADGALFCIACDYQTQKKQNLLVHMRKHSNAADPHSVRERPHHYMCMICSYSSPRRKNLYTHMRRKHHMQIVIKDDGTTCCYLDDVDGSVVIDDDKGAGTSKDLISTSQNILNAGSEPPQVVMLEMEPGGHVEKVKIEPTSRPANGPASEAEIAIDGLSALAQVTSPTQPTKVLQQPVEEKQNIEVSEEQLMQISAGDFIEINGEMYKVEFTST